MNFDPYTIGFIFAAFGSGAILGLIFSMVRLKKHPLISRLLSGDLIALVYDIDSSSFKLIPLVSLGGSTYLSAYPKYSLIIIKPETVEPYYFPDFGKSALFVVSKRPIGYAIDPTAFATIGISSVAIEDLDRTLKDKNEARSAFEKFMRKLLQMESKQLGVIRVNPTLEVGFAIDIKRVASALLSVRMAMATAGFTALRESVEKVRTFVEYWNRIQARGGFSWEKLILYGGLFLIFAAIAWAMYNAIAGH